MTATATLEARFPGILPYVKLMRLDRPIGTYLVLWPALWSLWIAAEGVPHWSALLIFVCGGFLMRSAGCVINDWADRNIDGDVERTRNRPLASGQVSPEHAFILFISLLILAFILVLLTNLKTILLSLGAVALASAYPFMKRYTYMPQAVLGAAFAWSVPMAFTAVSDTFPKHIWILYMAIVLWTIVYDTFYAMVDREDDIRIGVKSTAILFGEMDRHITSALQIIVIFALFMLGPSFSLGLVYYLSVVIAATLFGYQQYLIRDRDPEACFRAFMHNNWVGMVIFVGIAIDFALRSSATTP